MEVIPNEIKVINNGERKIVVYFRSDINTKRTDDGKIIYDYSVQTTGDGTMDNQPNSIPFKVAIFQNSNYPNPDESAKKYFQEKVKYYEEILGVEAQPDLVTKVSNNIKNLKDKFISSVTSTKKHDL